MRSLSSLHFFFLPTPPALVLYLFCLLVVILLRFLNFLLPPWFLLFVLFVSFSCSRFLSLFFIFDYLYFPSCFPLDDLFSCFPFIEFNFIYILITVILFLDISFTSIYIFFLFYGYFALPCFLSFLQITYTYLILYLLLLIFSYFLFYFYLYHSPSRLIF